MSYKDGEKYCQMCLETRGFTVIDRTQDPEFWIKDIDFTASKDGRSFNIEAKWDYKLPYYGTMFLELMTNVEQNKLGWARYTAADYIWYGDAKNLIFYIFRTEDMRKYLEDHKTEYYLRTAKDFDYYGNIRKTSLGAIVPIGSFKKAVRVQEMDIRSILQPPLLSL